MQPNDNNTNNTSNNGTVNNPPEPPEMDKMSERIERLGGEQAPDITPEEFARLQRSGSLHIDPQGRVRMDRREETDPGVSLRKRRAWYG
ncbi:MAG: hypothetical protein ABI947_13535 [Chloroflexota bacterium]